MGCRASLKVKVFAKELKIEAFDRWFPFLPSVDSSWTSYFSFASWLNFARQALIKLNGRKRAVKRPLFRRFLNPLNCALLLLFLCFFFFLFCTAHLSIHLHPSIPSQRDNWFGLRFRFGFGVSYRFGFRFRCRFEFGFGCGYRYRFRGMLNMSHVCHTCLAFVVEPNAQLQTYVNRKKPGSMYVHMCVCILGVYVAQWGKRNSKSGADVWQGSATNWVI